MELSTIEETVFLCLMEVFNMHEKVMREDYVKAYKLVIVLAVVLAVLSAIRALRVHNL